MPPHSRVDITVYRREMRPSWRLEKELEMPCRLTLSIVSRQGHVTVPFIIECRTQAALNHVRRQIWLLLKSLDGVIMDGPSQQG